METLSWSEILNLIGTDKEREALVYYVRALEMDRHRMIENKKKQISDAALYAPTENGKHDREARLIATMLDVDMRNYRRLYISPLRKCIKMERH